MIDLVARSIKARFQTFFGSFYFVRNQPMMAFVFILISAIPACLTAAEGNPAQYDAAKERSDKSVTHTPAANPLLLSDRLRARGLRPSEMVVAVKAKQAALPSVQLKAYVFRDASHATAILEVQGSGRLVLDMKNSSVITECLLGGSAFRLIGFDSSGFVLERVVDGAKLQIR